MSLITRNVVYRGYKISKSSINLPEVAKFGRIQVRLPCIKALSAQKDKISQIIEDTNFALVFDKLQYDLFRIKDLKLNTVLHFARGTDVEGLIMSTEIFDWIAKRITYSVTFSSNAGIPKGGQMIGGSLLNFGDNPFGYQGHLLINAGPKQFSVGSSSDNLHTVEYQEVADQFSLDNLRSLPIETMESFNEMEVVLSLLNRAPEPETKAVLRTLRRVELELFVNGVSIRKFVLPTSKVSESWGHETIKASESGNDLFKGVRSAYDRNLVPTLPNKANSADAKKPRGHREPYNQTAFDCTVHGAGQHRD